MSGLLIAALGLAIAAWQLRGITRSAATHPAIFRSRPGAVIVFVLAGCCILIGGRAAMAFFQSAGPVTGALIGVAIIISLAFMKTGAHPLLRELKVSRGEFRRDYPDLDEEAMYRYVVKKRHPEWETGIALRLTENCPSLNELATRIARKESELHG